MEHINQFKVWKHFTWGDGNGSATSSKTISCKGGSTSGLFRHLKSKCKLSLESEEEDQPFSAKKAKTKQKSITSFLEGKKGSLQSTVSQVVAVDDFSIHAIGKIKFICESISAKLEAFVVCTFVVYCIVV